MKSDDPAVKSVEEALRSSKWAKSVVEDAGATIAGELTHLRAEAVAQGHKLGSKLEAEYLNALCDIDDAADCAKMLVRRLELCRTCIKRAVRKAEKKYPTK